MLLALLGWVQAAEPERLEGFHFGIGGGLGFYSWSNTSSDGTESSGISTSTSMTMRFRLGRILTLEPGVSGTHEVTRSYALAEDAAADTRAVDDRYRLGLRARVRLASVDELDLVGIVGVSHRRAWDSLQEEPEGARETAFTTSTDAGIGVSIEYWLARRVSLSVEVGSDVLGWTTARYEPSDRASESVRLELNPSGAA
ncbi:MAG: outer membrane beta-barrel protein, partial [Myxococcota bacterium]